MATALKLMESFSQRERFTWRDNTFTVMIPNGTRTVYHPRASAAQLKALLIPELRMTRAGNISGHQPSPPPPQPYDFYLAQLIHYGLDFHFEIDTAKRALEMEIILGRLHVPPSLLVLEKGFRRAHDQKRKAAHEHTVAQAVNSRPRRNGEARGSIGAVADESGPDTARTAASTKATRPKPRKHVTGSSSRSTAQFPTKNRLHGTRRGSATESDNASVAPDTHTSTSSNTGEISSSEAGERDVKGPTLSSSSEGTVGDDSANSSTEGGESSDDDRKDEGALKKVKLEKGGYSDGSFPKMDQRIASTVRQAERLPLQAGNRPAPSRPQAPVRPIHLAGKENPRVSRTNATPPPAIKGSSGKPFVSAERRPFWTIPVRSSPRADQESPNLAIFSHAQRTTQPQAHGSSKGTFPLDLETPSRSAFRTTSPQSSASSAHSQPPQLRSILKKGTELGSRESPIPLPRNGSRPRISVDIPPHRDTKSAALGQHGHKRKRKSGALADPEPVQGFSLTGLDGTHSPPPVTLNSLIEKPLVVSDIVDGKPVPQPHSSGNSHMSRKPSDDEVYGVARGVRGFMAVNSGSSHQFLELDRSREGPKIHKDQPGEKAGKSGDVRHHKSKDAGKEMIIPRVDGNRSRGSLVRAGLVL